MKKRFFGLTAFFTTLVLGYVIVPKISEKILVTKEKKTEIIVSKPEILDAGEKLLSDVKEYRIKMMEAGEGFHGDEIEAKNGETWMGLFRDKDKYLLRPTKVSVTLVHDEIIDKKGQKTGKTVKVSGKGEPLFLLKNTEYILEKREVKSLYDWQFHVENAPEEVAYSVFEKDFAKEFFFNNQKFVLKTKTGFNAKNKKIFALVLENGGISQTLYSIEYEGEPQYLGQLLWVGDLDGDDKPDFYMSLSIHENLDYKALFLSSMADEENLVKQVADIFNTGC